MSGVVSFGAISGNVTVYKGCLGFPFYCFQSGLIFNYFKLIVVASNRHVWDVTQLRPGALISFNIDNKELKEGRINVIISLA